MPLAQPLFVPDMETLKARLRMGTAGDPGTVAGEVLQGFVEDVRVGIYSQLGATVITTILATPINVAGTTQAQLNRLRAVSLEVEWVRFRMMESGDIFTQDNAASARQTFQDEGTPRRTSYSDQRKMLEDQWARILGLLGYLLTGPEEESAFLIKTIGPATVPPYPGQSIVVGDAFGPE